MEKARVNGKGQIVIPEALKIKYGFTNGMRVVLEETQDGILLKPMNEQYFEKFAGILEGNGNLKAEMKQMKKEEMELEERKMKFYK